MKEANMMTDSPNPLTLAGMIIDVDGTLVLSNDAHTHAWLDAFKESGHDVAYEQVRPLMGMGGDQLLPRVVPGLQADSPEGKRLTQRRKAIFLERYAPTLQPTPGAHALVVALQQMGLNLIVGSSAASDELQKLLDVAGVAQLLPNRTTSDDAQSTKPAPDVVQVALQRLGLPAQAVALLGDAPYDIHAAGQVGVPIIAVRCGGFSDADLAEAYAIYDDPQDLLAHLREIIRPAPLSGSVAEAARQGTDNVRGDEESTV
jgi:HAD superfamily hydrolase (TIGR01509 family)